MLAEFKQALLGDATAAGGVQVAKAVAALGSRDCGVAPVAAGRVVVNAHPVGRQVEAVGQRCGKAAPALDRHTAVVGHQAQRHVADPQGHPAGIEVGLGPSGDADQAPIAPVKTDVARQGQAAAQVKVDRAAQAEVGPQQRRQVEVKAKTLEIQAGQQGQKIGEVEVGPIDLKIGEGQPQVPPGQVGPAQRWQVTQAGHLEADAAQVELGQGQHQLGQGQVGPVEVQVRESCPQVGQPQFRQAQVGGCPAGQQPERIEADGDPGQVQPLHRQHQLRQGQLGPVEAKAWESEVEGVEPQLGQVEPQGRPVRQPRRIKAEAQPRQLQGRDLGQQLGQGQVGPVDVETGESRRQAGQGPAGPGEARQLTQAGQGQAQARQVEAGDGPQQIPQGGGLPVEVEAGQGQTQLGQLEVGQGQAEGCQGRQQGPQVHIQLQASQLEAGQGQHQLGQAQVRPVEIELGEGCPQLAQLEVGPAQTGQISQGRQGQLQPRQVEPRQRQHQIGQGQVGPVEAQAWELGRQLGQLELGPAGQQPRQVQIDLQTREVELGQGQQQLRQAQSGPVDLEIGEGQPQLRQGHGGPAQLGRDQRQVGVQAGPQTTEVKEVEAQGQVDRVERQVAHQGGDPVGLGEGHRADLEVAAGTGATLQAANHHRAANPPQLQPGAAVLAGIAKAQVRAPVLQGHPIPLDRGAVGHQGEGFAANAHRAPQAEGGAGQADAQVEVSADFEQVALTGPEVQGRGADRAVEGFARAVEGQRGAAHRPQHQPRDGAAVGLAEAQVGGAEPAGAAAGPQHQGARDAAPPQGDAVVTAAGPDLQAGVPEAQAQVGIGLAGQFGRKTAAEGLAADTQTGLTAEGGGQRRPWGAAAQRHRGGTTELHGAAAAQAQSAAELTRLQPRGAIDQGAAELVEAQADAGTTGSTEVQPPGLQSPTVIGRSRSTSVKAQGGTAAQLGRTGGQVELVEGHFEQVGGQGQTQGLGGAGGPVDDGPTAGIEPAVEGQLPLGQADAARQGHAGQAAGGAQPAAAGLGAGAAGQHPAEVEPLQVDPQAPGAKAGGQVGAAETQLVHRGAAAVGQGDGLGVGSL